ncbi:MAG TPA: SDR family oxidoreductase [Casimicrobiaceae bacterium]|nr:SDR family oxidoreductase [Casimicrobiaceae bacterium]
MDLALRDKVAIVGGASQGIGFAIARLLASEGMQVAMVARHRELLDQAVAEVNAQGSGRAVAIAGDIRKAEDCERIVAEAARALGRLDMLVNNDGAPPLGRIDEFDDQAWSRAIEQNLMSVVRLSRHAMPHLRAAGGGTITNITALSVLQPLPRFGLSVASWAGVLGYAKTLALEVAADRIRVNTICPGRIATGRLDKVYGTGAGGPAIDDAALADMAKQVPLGRVGTPDEIAGLVAFLASPWGGYITGATFHVDGGRRANLY